MPRYLADALLIVDGSHVVATRRSGHHPMPLALDHQANRLPEGTGIHAIAQSPNLLA